MCVLFSVRLPELVAVCVLLIHIHEVIQGDKVGLVVDIEDTSLDVIDVVAIVIDILGRSFPVGQDVIIVPEKLDIHSLYQGVCQTQNTMYL